MLQEALELFWLREILRLDATVCMRLPTRPHPRARLAAEMVPVKLPGLGAQLLERQAACREGANRTVDRARGHCGSRVAPKLPPDVIAKLGDGQLRYVADEEEELSRCPRNML
eukprot:6836073-Prymnesium_polylepis.1